MIGILAAMIVLLAMAPAGAEECGAGGRCQVEGGYYLAAPPPGWDGSSPLPLIVFFHGWNSSPEATFGNRAMLAAAHGRGALFVAPYARTGYWRQIGAGRAERGRDELAFTQAVMKDIRARWPIDERRSLASGFSRGASMVWNLACYAGDMFRAYAPIAGGFWTSTPNTCPSGAVSLRHIHGTRDEVVAFDRRGIYDSRPITEGMTLLRRQAGCPEPPDAARQQGKLRCESWTTCESGERLELCLHGGGHSIPAEWVAEGLDWLEAGD